MPDGIRWVGLDVHARESTMAVFDQGTGSSRRGGIGQALQVRQRDQPAEVIDIAWRAQRRQNARWRQLNDARHKHHGIVVVAIARELAGYCWEIATWNTHPDPVPPASMPAGDPLTHAHPVPHKHEHAM